MEEREKPANQKHSGTLWCRTGLNLPGLSPSTCARSCSFTTPVPVWCGRYTFHSLSWFEGPFGGGLCPHTWGKPALETHRSLNSKQWTHLSLVLFLFEVPPAIGHSLPTAPLHSSPPTSASITRALRAQEGPFLSFLHCFLTEQSARFRFLPKIPSASSFHALTW